ncbi:cytosine permease, partial [Sulfuracidifex metallicus]|uniref:cytosine permease n=1 Tax=Sulfuracidifex metallicus TaxID=47303 RepID=UPI000A76D27F
AGVALFWFAVQSYVGGTIIDAVISIMYKPWTSLTAPVLGMPEHLAISFLIFWVLNVAVLFGGMEEIKNFELVAGPS